MDTISNPRALLHATEARLSFTSDLDPGALIDGGLFAAFDEGDLPAARYVHVARVAEDNDLALPGGQVVRTVAWQHTRWMLIDGPSWRVRLRVDSDGETFAWVFGTTMPVVDRIARIITRWNVKVSPQPDTVDVTFCYQNRHCLARHRRRIAASAWPAISANYTTPVRAVFEPLVAADPSRLDGRLLLLWGPPGTGKTTLLRSLARHWSAWCDTVYVTDPDRLFSEAAYLNELVLERDDDGPDERWVLLVLEDCDELIRPNAKHASGQALSRLLNLTDGMVGQGLRLLVCITTNEELWRLHPAVTRPGRCLAQVEVGRLSCAEAAQWLEAHDAADSIASDVGPDGATLAELFALRTGRLAAAGTSAPIGQYL